MFTRSLGYVQVVEEGVREDVWEESIWRLCRRRSERRGEWVFGDRRRGLSVEGGDGT